MTTKEMEKLCSKNWPDEESLVNYFKNEGFEVGKTVCLECGIEMFGIHPPGTDSYKLECLKCKSTRSLFTPM